MRHLRTLAIAAGFLLALYLGHPVLLQGLGRYLVYETPLEKADAILVLAGGVPARILEAVDLYRQGYARRIIITREVPPDGYEHLASLGVKLPSSVDINLMILRHLGIPRRDVDVIEGEADSTLGELCYVTKFMERRPFRSLILVTDKSHSKRASKILRLLTNGKVKILSRPTKYNDFQAEAWWRRRSDVKDVLFEYQKLINHWRIAAVAKVLTAVDALPGIHLSVRDYLCPSRPEGKT